MREDHSKGRFRIVVSTERSDCPENEGATNAQRGKLLPLRHGAAYLSSRFQIDHARLSSEGRAKVNSMIELFFEHGIGTHSPSSALVGRETQKFVCAIGIIYYFRSREHRAPVMQCFVLHSPSGGGGGHVRFFSSFCSASIANENDDYCPSERRIAARLDDLLHCPPGDEIAAHAVSVRSDPETTKTVRGRRRAHARLRGDRLLGEIAQTCRALLSKPTLAVLPAWSLLRRQSLAAEQLENAFARAIFAGEAVSHLGRSLSLFSNESGELDHWRRHQRAMRLSPIDPRALFEETRRVLQAIHARNIIGDMGKCQYFASLSFARDDIFSDVRYLSMLRSEMIFHFATFLAERRKAKYDDVAYRFAKLAHFTEVSVYYFETQDSNYPLTQFFDEIEIVDGADNWMSNKLLLHIQEFGAMSTKIVESLIDVGCNRIIEISEYSRLCELASQILLGDYNIDPIESSHKLTSD